MLPYDDLLQRHPVELLRRALRDIQRLMADLDLDDSDLEFRARQLVECAGGAICPELAFHPMARLLHGVAATQVVATRRWQQMVGGAIRRGLARRRRHRVAPVASMNSAVWRAGSAPPRARIGRCSERSRTLGDLERMTVSNADADGDLTTPPGDRERSSLR